MKIIETVTFFKENNKWKSNFLLKIRVSSFFLWRVCQPSLSYWGVRLIYMQQFLLNSNFLLSWTLCTSRSACCLFIIIWYAAFHSFVTTHIRFACVYPFVCTWFWLCIFLYDFIFMLCLSVLEHCERCNKMCYNFPCHMYLR